MKLRNYVLLLIAIVVIIGCKTPPKPLPDCISVKTKDMSVRWGEADKKNKTLKGFMMNGTGKIFSFNHHDSVAALTFDIPQTEYIELGLLEGKWFCEATNKIQNAILKTQVSNEPGDSTEFLEFSNPSANIFYRAQWVRKFKTKNSELFRKVYDSLQTYKLFHAYKFSTEE